MNKTQVINKLRTIGHTVLKFIPDNVLNWNFLIYAVVSYLVILFSYPERFWDFDSSLLRSFDYCKNIFLYSSLQDVIQLQFALLLAFYGLTLFIPKKIRAVLQVTLLFGLSLYALMNCYLVFRYSCPAIDMIVVLNSSDMQEVREYFASLFLENKVFLFTGIFCLIAIPAGMVFALIRTREPANKKTFAGILVGVALLFYVFPPYSWDFAFWRKMQAIDFLYYLSQKDFFLVRAADVVKQPQLPEGSENALKDRESVLGLLVLGESDCRRNHSLYGYEKNTDVKMAEFEGRAGFFKFRNMLSPTSSTQHTIYFMFTNALIRDKYGPSSFSVCEWFRTAGASVYWLSNQRAHGAWTSMAALLFARADRLEFYSDGSGNTYDRIHLLPHVRTLCSELKDKKEPAFIVAHIMGSHYVQRYRIDDEWRAQNGDKLENLDIYDQTLVYTDEMLWTMAKDIEAMERPAFFLYMPDHAEQLNSTRSAKAPDVIYYEIPVYLYCNEAYRKAFPGMVEKLGKVLDVPYQTDLAVWLMARLMNMPEKLIPAEQDLLSDKFKIVPRYLEFGERVYDEK